MTMTNNPTIDGVSLLPCPFCGGDAVLKQYRADGLEIRCTGCQSMRQQRWMYKGRGWLETKMIEKWNERLTPPAERQEPVVLLSEHRKGLDAYLEQIKDQQSTIARLEAQVAELESGRGDDWLSLAHEFQLVGLKYWYAHQRERGDGAVKFLHNDETGATFVVTRGEYAQELKDFIFGLDATAALNGPAK